MCVAQPKSVYVNDWFPPTHRTSEVYGERNRSQADTHFLAYAIRDGMDTRKREKIAVLGRAITRGAVLMLRARETTNRRRWPPRASKGRRPPKAMSDLYRTKPPPEWGP